MDEKKKLVELIIDSLEITGENCEICTKIGHKCPVYIPENADTSFKPDFSQCNFKSMIYKTLTIED